MIIIFCQPEIHCFTFKGRLSESLGRLFSLERIDLSDNDIKGSIPDALSRLVNLNTLRLSYNLLTGNLPVQLIQLENLELAHFQSNRLTGEIILNNDLMVDPSSFISDCGVPTGEGNQHMNTDSVQLLHGKTIGITVVCLFIFCHLQRFREYIIL